MIAIAIAIAAADPAAVRGLDDANPRDAIRQAWLGTVPDRFRLAEAGEA